MGDGCGGGRISQDIHLTGFAHVPILTKLTGQVTTGCPEGEGWGAGKKMVKGFFFNRVDAKPAGAAISRQDDLVFFAGTDKTHAPLLLLKLTEPWAEIALYTAILQPMPVFGRISRDLIVSM
jgi:hypothetical protein